LALVSNLSGHAKAQLVLSMESMQEELDVRVYASEFTAQGNYSRIPGDLNISNTEFDYETDKVTLRRFSGQVDTSTITNLYAIFDFSFEDHIQVQSGMAHLDMEKLMPWLKSFDRVMHIISPLKDVKGDLVIDAISIDGNILEPEKWQYDIQGSGGNLSLDLGMGLSDMASMSCSYRFSDKGISIANIEADLPQLDWLSPYVEKKYLVSVLAPIKITEGNFDFKKNNISLTGDSTFKTGPRVSFSLHGKDMTSIFLDQVAIFEKDISNAKIIFSEDLTKPLFNFEGILNTKTIELMLKPDSFLYDKLVSFTAGDPIFILANKRSDLSIMTKKLNLNTILSSEETKKPVNKRLLPKKAINFRTDFLQYKKYTLTDITAQILMGGHDTFITLNHMDLCGLKTNGTVNLKDDLVETHLKINATNKDNINNLLTCLFDEDNLLDGSYTVSLELNGDGFKKDIKHILDAKLNLTA